MIDLTEVLRRRHVGGEPRARRAVVLSVAGLLALASVAFVLGADVGLSAGWIAIAVGLAVVAGWAGAGLGPTVGSLWLVGLWWFAFPPLVGFLGGEWSGAGRYAHPRTMGFAYGSARAELVGGLEYGLQYGLLFAVLLGTLAYVAGATARRIASRLAGR